jgi:hypothetical protein
MTHFKGHLDSTQVNSRTLEITPEQFDALRAVFDQYHRGHNFSRLNTDYTGASFVAITTRVQTNSQPEGESCCESYG